MVQQNEGTAPEEEGKGSRDVWCERQASGLSSQARWELVSRGPQDGVLWRKGDEIDGISDDWGEGK
jgi:hypothetical protein